MQLAFLGVLYHLLPQYFPTIIADFFFAWNGKKSRNLMANYFRHWVLFSFHQKSVRKLTHTSIFSWPSTYCYKYFPKPLSS
jgi:hypothetical protein